MKYTYIEWNNNRNLTDCAPVITKYNIRYPPAAPVSHNVENYEIMNVYKINKR